MCEGEHGKGRLQEVGRGASAPDRSILMLTWLSLLSLRAFRMEVDIQTKGCKRMIIILHLHFTNMTELFLPTQL